MATSGNKIAEAFVQIVADLNPFHVGLRNVRTSLMDFVRRPLTIPGGGILAALGLGVSFYGISRAIGHAIDSASHFNETVNRTKVLFGPAASIITDEADEMARKYGTVKNAFVDAATSFGGIFQGVGATDEKAVQLGVRLTKLAQDMASFGDKPFEQATGALQAAFARSEFDPIEQFNLRLTAAKVSERAMAMGLAQDKQHISDYAKTLAILALVEEQTARQAGDLARTIDDPENAAKAARGRIENLSTTIGTQLLPMYKAWENLSNEVLLRMTDASVGMQSSLQGFVDYAVGGIELLGFGFRNFWDILAYFQSIAQDAFDDFGNRINWLADVAGAFADWFGANWSNVFLDAFDLIGQALANLGTNFVSFGKAAYQWIASGFKDPFNFTLSAGIDTSKLRTTPFEAPEFRAMPGRDDERDAIAARMAETERKRAAMGDLSNPEGKVAEAAARGATKESKAEVVNVSSIANELAKAALGQKDPLLAEAKTQTEQLTAIAANTAKAAVGGRAKFAGP